jgi:hypothetical protein
MNELSQLISKITNYYDGSATRLAAELGVSETSVNRWIQNKSRPRPNIEAQLRTLAARITNSASQVSEEATLYHTPDDREVLGNAIDSTLAEVREILHRRGRLSSRNEALEEVGVLLFAHISDVRDGGAGISGLHSKQLPSRAHSAATSLHFFVESKLKKEALGNLFINGQGRYLKLGSDEEAVANEIIGAFIPLSKHENLLRNTGYDILNEVFGKFISDSFIDEKELGQYLTPPEVVEFMAEMAAQVLHKDEYSLLTNRSTSSSFGLILDPSCGIGSFLTATSIAIARKIKQREPAFATQFTPSNILSHFAVGIDKSERMIKLARLSFAMFGQQSPRLLLSNALARNGAEGEITKSLEGKARLILTNPPFGATYRLNDLVKYRIVTSWSRRKPGPVDSEVLFLERYIDWLMPGGHLLAIVPDSILTNKGIYSDLRNGLAQSANLLSVISLPSVAFASAGTTTKTSIIHLQKLTHQRSKPNQTKFAVCKTLGYEVITRGSQRIKRYTGSNELPIILRELLSNRPKAELITLGDDTINSPRWDAQHHGSLSAILDYQLKSNHNSQIRIRDVAELVNERTNPVRFNSKIFQYIEISDIDSKELKAIPKLIETSDAPSRARKLARFGDVLVSTVRPERGTVGVVLETSGPVVCTTGVAVLRPHQIHPFALARLLLSKFVIEQLVRNNVGIAYPAIEEEILPDIILPIRKDDIARLNRVSLKLIAREQELRKLRAEFASVSSEIETAWSKVTI